MSTSSQNSLIIHEATQVLERGGVIAYPTEAVYGLGCNPMNESAVLRVLELKKRSMTKGLILIAADWQQIKPYIHSLDAETMANIMAWSKPITWVFSATVDVPPWITGSHASIAVRVTKHPFAKALCEHFGKPIVSTSANLEGRPPAKSVAEVKDYFPSGIDLILVGKLGNLDKPTQIRDAETGRVIRS